MVVGAKNLVCARSHVMTQSSNLPITVRNFCVDPGQLWRRQRIRRQGFPWRSTTAQFHLYGGPRRLAVAGSCPLLLRWTVQAMEGRTGSQPVGQLQFREGGCCCLWAELRAYRRLRSCTYVVVRSKSCSRNTIPSDPFFPSSTSSFPLCLEIVIDGA